MTSVDSTSDDRVKNNVMAHEYRLLSEDEKLMMKALKDHGLQFIEMCDNAGQSREMSIAKTNMEQAVMWAVKAIVK